MESMQTYNVIGKIKDGIEATESCCACIVASGDGNNGSVDHICQICSHKITV